MVPFDSILKKKLNMDFIYKPYPWPRAQDNVRVVEADLKITLKSHCIMNS